MKGGGVGANYSTPYLEALPPVVGVVTVFFDIARSHPDHDEVKRSPDVVMTSPLVETWSGAERFVVPDSRAGWVAALGHLIDLTPEPGLHVVVFDLSAVRPRGSLIRGFGGTASGPAPLATALVATADVLAGAVGRHLTPLEAMSIDHAVSACV